LAQVRGERVPDFFGKRKTALPTRLPGSDQNAALNPIDIIDPQPDYFLSSQAKSREQKHHSSFS
jgi:hypothetical protein